MTEAARPLVLLIEDDLSARQFVSMALEDLPVQVVEAESLSQARQLMAQRHIALVLTDMTLKDGNATVLVEELAQKRGANASPQVVVLSGGIYPETRQHLALLGVTHFLHKPASLTEIEDTVKALLHLEAAPVQAASPAPVAPRGDLADFEREAVATYFDGDTEFYKTYKSMSLMQFEVDMQEGDNACAHLQPQELRRTAHSMKSVLRTLGHAELSVLAKTAEDAAHLSPWPEAVAAWATLRQAVQAMVLAHAE